VGLAFFVTCIIFVQMLVHVCHRGRLFDPYLFDRLHVA
jgi:hypothetical protein